MEAREERRPLRRIVRMVLVFAVLALLTLGQQAHRIEFDWFDRQSAEASVPSPPVAAVPMAIDTGALAQPIIGAGECQFFPETNISVCDSFLNYWRAYGGLEIFGFPLSWVYFEDGFSVQYFERAKLEYHPELVGTEWVIVGELTGRAITEGREGEAPFQAVGGLDGRTDCTFFELTGHRLCGGFRDYWDSHGGLWMFGYPISEEFFEANPDTGQTYTVQYFERARFEWHPENAGTPYAVLLGRLGAQLFDERRPRAPYHQRFNVRDFGARGDGVTDDTDAINAALDAAGNVGTGTAGVVYVPTGTYMVRASHSHHDNTLTLHRRSILVGDGADKSAIKLIASSIDPTWNNIRLLLVETSTRVTGLRFDGSRDQVDRARFSDIASSIVRTKSNAAEVAFENLIVENAYGQLQGDEYKEALAISTNDASAVTIRQIEARNNDGAGISTDGSYYGSRASNVLIENVRLHNNRSMGMTFYGAQSVIARGIIAFGNSRGINIEWTDGLTIHDAEVFDNTRRGISLIGLSSGIRLENVTTRNNGGGFESGSEIGLMSGSLRQPDPATGGFARGINQDITLINCSLTPASGGAHFFINPDPSGITTGEVFPNAVLLHTPGWETWRFNIANTWMDVLDVPSFVQNTYGVAVRTQ